MPERVAIVEELSGPHIEFDTTCTDLYGDEVVAGARIVLPNPYPSHQPFTHVFVSLGNVQRLVDALRSPECVSLSGDRVIGRAAAAAHDYGHGWCAVCREDCRRDNLVIVSDSGNANSLSVCHLECRDRLSDGLEALSDDPDRWLADAI